MTFLTEEDAKKALIVARSNFDPFTLPEGEAPFVDLLGDDYHLDYDENFK